MRKIFLLLCCVALTGTMLAQKQNNVWAFGDQMGIDFNTSPPSVIQPAMITYGGSASVSDTSGQLLFYTQGDTIWNKNNQIMPNGSGLIAPYISNSILHWTPQGQLIVPMINNPGHYYVFSMETDDDINADTNASRLFYSVVDMSLNGGLGDVVSGEKGIQIDSQLTSCKMIAVAGDSCDVWLLVHRWEDATFKAYKITDTGINMNPVVSVSGNPLLGAYINGKMKISPDGQKLAVTNLYNLYLNNFGGYGCELFDFNKSTGVVSNPVVLDSLVQGISACFSPDNSKLYYFSFGGGNGDFYQFDLSQPTTAAIVASQTMIDSLVTFGTGEDDAQLGPDGKIYVSFPYSIAGPYTNTYDSIGRIDAPNAAGTACNYTRAALISAQVSYSNGDLPNSVVVPLQDSTYVDNTTNLTLTGTLTLQAPSGYSSYLWNNGDTSESITVSSTGTYWRIARNYCEYRVDTFIVNPPLGVNNLLSQTTGMIAYPNPAFNDITVMTNDAHATGYIKVIDVLGKTVVNTVANGNVNHINVALLAAGVYQLIYINDKAPDRPMSTGIIIKK